MNKKQTKIYFVIGIIILIIISLAFLSLPNKEKVIKIGVITDLSGPSAWIGDYQKKGIDLAVSEINNQGGINGRLIKVFYEDHQANPSKGVSAFNRLMLEKPDIMVISHSSIASSLLPLINKKKIPTFLIAVSLPGITDQSNWAIRTHVGSDDEAKIIADLLNNKFSDIDSMAVIYVNDEFGVGGEKVFEQEYDKQIPVQEAFSKTQSDFKTIITKIKNSDVKGIYIIGYTLAVPSLLKQLKEMDVNLPIFTNLAIGSPSFIKASGDAINGIYLPSLKDSFKNPKDIVVKDFVDKYSVKYNEDPSLFSAFGYTAIKIFEKAAINKDISDREDLIKGIKEINNFSTPVGKISILPNGNIEFSLKVVQLVNNSMNDFYPK